MHGFEQRPRSRLPNFSSLRWRSASDLFLDPVQLPDAFQRLFCHRRRMPLVQVEELPSYVRPARGLDDGTRLVQPVEARDSHRPAGCRDSSSDDSPDVRPCDPASRRTTPPKPLHFLPADHREHRSTVVPSSSYRCPVRAPEPAHRRHAVSPRSAHNSSVLPPEAAASGSRRPPSRPWSSGPVRRLPAHRSPTAGTAEDGRRTSRPAHAPAGRDRRDPCRSGRCGAGSCTMREQQAQLSFGRTVRITLKRAGTYSSISRNVFAERAQLAAAVRAGFLLRRDRFDLARQFGGKRTACRLLCSLLVHGGIASCAGSGSAAACSLRDLRAAVRAARSRRSSSPTAGRSASA